MIVSTVLAAALASSGVCQLPAAAAAPDAEAAKAFVEVGDSELASGNTDTAAAAYREALRLAPANRRAREGFLDACARASPSATLASGRALMNAGERRAAIEIFERLREGRPNPTAALLEGICFYEEEDDESARPLLLEARAAPDLAARASYFLGLIELRNGAGSDAAAYFEQAMAVRPEPLAERAQLLRLAAFRSGRAVISVFAESGYDSNVNYTPAGSPASGDGDGAAGLAAWLRPLGLSGPYLRASGFYRRQVQVNDRDLGIFGGLAGWRLGRGESYLFADYGFEATLLGSSPYFYAHRLRAAARKRVGRIALFALYGVRFGAYQTPVSAPYSGVLHTIDSDVSFRFPLGSSIALGYHAGRDVADSVDAASWEHGPRAFLRFVLFPSLRASGEAAWTWRLFDAPSAGNSQARSDRILYLGAALEKDIADRLTLRLAGGERIASSNVPAYTYSRFTAALALSYTIGIY